MSGGARSDINYVFLAFRWGARPLQNFCSRYGPAPVINVAEDLFTQHFFLEGYVLSASVKAHPGKWMLPWARFGSSFFWEGPILLSGPISLSEGLLR